MGVDNRGTVVVEERRMGRWILEQVGPTTGPEVIMVRASIYLG